MWLEKTIERDSQQKLYVQIYAIIKDRIEKGEWSAGTQIPTEDSLCRTYDVSKATVRLAISELVREGLLKRQQGKGTFVNYSFPRMGMAMKTRLTEDMFGEGVRVRKEIVSKGVKKPSEDIRTFLRVEQEIYYILCTRVVDGETAYVEESFIPLFMFPDIENVDLCRMPLYDLIQERAARRVSKVVQTIEVTDMTSHAATILKVQEGSPALLLHRLLLGPDMSPIAYTRLFGSGRKYKLQTEFERIR